MSRRVGQPITGGPRLCVARRASRWYYHCLQKSHRGYAIFPRLLAANVSHDLYWALPFRLPYIENDEPRLHVLVQCVDDLFNLPAASDSVKSGTAMIVSGIRPLCIHRPWPSYSFASYNHKRQRPTSTPDSVYFGTVFKANFHFSGRLLPILHLYCGMSVPWRKSAYMHLLTPQARQRCKDELQVLSCLPYQPRHTGPGSYGLARCARDSSAQHGHIGIGTDKGGLGMQPARKQDKIEIVHISACLLELVYGSHLGSRLAGGLFPVRTACCVTRPGRLDNLTQLCQ